MPVALTVSRSTAYRTRSRIVQKLCVDVRVGIEINEL